MNVSANLFAMAVGIKQKDLVDKMVKKVVQCVFFGNMFYY